MNPAYTTGARGGPGHAGPAEPRTPWEEPGCPVTPGTLTSQALLNCLVREVSGPEQQTWAGDGALNVRLARSGVLLRATLRRPSAGLGPRLTGAVQRQHGACWQPVGWDDLTRLIATELTLATGVTNEEFAAQVRDSHAALAAILAVRPEPSRHIPAPGGDAPDEAGDRRIECYLASEQALVAGHRFHPAPKARAGRSRDWLRYAPEAGVRFSLRFLGVHDDVLAGDGDTTALERLGGGPDAPPGYRLLPTHPWQLGLLEQRPWFAAARRGGLLLDLGPGARDVVPTSSVRTVYDHGTDTFAKFSLNIRITNCVRTSAWYEMAGSVVLSGLLRPVFRDLAGLFPGTVLLAEPGYRTVALADREAYEGLAVIVRDGLRRSLAPGVTPLLAAALTEPPRTEPPRTEPGPARSRTEPGPARRLFGGRHPDWLLAWWDAYLRRLVPPVLHALFAHGVVLEPHLQNVLVGVDTDGWPEQVIVRDLEGVKLVAAQHERLLATVAPGVARGLAYDRERGWNRVAYCLIVNHLAEIAAAIADYGPGQQDRIEAALWDRARHALAGFARDHGWTPELRALLAGAPLPAKANLTARWARAADRDAVYLPVRNPLSERGTR